MDIHFPSTIFSRFIYTGGLWRRQRSVVQDEGQAIKAISQIVAAIFHGIWIPRAISDPRFACLCFAVQYAPANRLLPVDAQMIQDCQRYSMDLVASLERTLSAKVKPSMES